jgi:serine/threonine protein kinase
LSKEFNPINKEVIQKKDTEYVATRWYRAPELLLRFPSYDYKVDIFALGCIMIELFTGIPMASGATEFD